MSYEKTTWVNDVTAVSANNMNHIEDGIKDAHDILDNIFNAIYPVGSIYMSASLSTHEQVEALFGGTWEAWGKGRVPVGVDTAQTEFDTVEETGGAKTHSHTNSATTGSTTLTVNQIPSHSHSDAYSSNKVGLSASGSASSTAFLQLSSNTVTGAISTSAYSTGNAGGGQGHTHTLNSTGDSSTLQPYITCYMYKRTA